MYNGSLGGSYQPDNVYQIKLSNILNPNFVVCSPSAYTEDDCQYTNSSALRSVISSAVKTLSTNKQRKRRGKYIETDEKREEDLSS